MRARERIGGGLLPPSPFLLEDISIRLLGTATRSNFFQLPSCCLPLNSSDSRAIPSFNAVARVRVEISEGFHLEIFSKVEDEL